MAAACSVCDASRRPLLCPSCFEGSCAGRRADLAALAEQRDAAAQQLASLVADKVGAPAPSTGGGRSDWT